MKLKVCLILVDAKKNFMRQKSEQGCTGISQAVEKEEKQIMFCFNSI
jgi:hypothetical protein